MAQRDEAGTDHLSNECGTQKWEFPSDLAGGGCQSRTLYGNDEEYKKLLLCFFSIRRSLCNICNIIH